MFNLTNDDFWERNLAMDRFSRNCLRRFNVQYSPEGQKIVQNLQIAIAKGNFKEINRLAEQLDGLEKDDLVIFAMYPYF